MDTNVRTPQEVFYLPQYLEVPLFQRSYVWDLSDQWLPLWQDITRIAELRLRDPRTQANHFLGAIVVQGAGPIMGTVPISHLIDGQQRLTTLQLLIDATAGVLEEHGVDGFARQLVDLTHNRAYSDEEPATLKLRHTNRDSDAFREVMAAEPPVEYGLLKHSGSLIARAHEFFSTRVAGWLGSPSSSDGFSRRAGALVEVLTQGLQLVVISLQANEDSQEIFETLNARGTPLTAADLIKNFVFQRLDAEGVDIRRAYSEDWPFEKDFWDTGVPVGRNSMTRGSVFLGQWLAAQVGDEISPRQTFTRFKHYVDHEATKSMADILAAIKVDADQYEAWTQAAADQTRELTITEMAFYRMQAAGIEVLKPAIIWLHDPALGYPESTINSIIRMLESWVIRRQLLRLDSGSLGRVLAELIRANRGRPPSDIEANVRSHLTRLNVATTYWPGDQELRDQLQQEQAYRRYPRSRLRMYLEAYEDDIRAVHQSPCVPRIGYPIEHVLPQRWQTNWPVDGLEAELDRAEHIHRFGNLTLLTQSLNSTVSNGPWLGRNGKRAHLVRHDVFLMNRQFRECEVWDESGIEARTAEIIDGLLAVWPVPDGHKGEITDPAPVGQSWVEIKHIVAAGLLAPGTELHPSGSTWSDSTAVITVDGSIAIDGQEYSTPSGAGRHVRGRATNGWMFWRVPDGRRLFDVRQEFREDGPLHARDRFDWTRLHQILELIPAGRWTTYAALADAVGTAPQPLAKHIVSCGQCSNPWRVLTTEGRVADDLRSTDPTDNRDPVQLLQAEGLAFNGGRADPEHQLTSDQLGSLVNDG